MATKIKARKDGNVRAVEVPRDVKFEVAQDKLFQRWNIAKEEYPIYVLHYTMAAGDAAGTTFPVVGDMQFERAMKDFRAAKLPAPVFDIVNLKERKGSVSAPATPAKPTPASTPAKPVATTPTKPTPASTPAKPAEPAKVAEPTPVPTTPAKAAEPAKPAETPKAVEDKNICLTCGKRVVGSKMQALGRNWHPSCFVCHRCGSDLPSAFHARDGYPYCDACYEAEFSQFCTRCGKPVREMVMVNGNAYHRECFTCSKCNNPIQSRFLMSDGNPICEDCATA